MEIHKQGITFVLLLINLYKLFTKTITLQWIPIQLGR